MPATQTLFVDLTRIQAQASDGVLVIRLMRAADDIALANWGLRQFTASQPSISAHVQDGARRYFVRLQCGHVTEGLGIVGEVTTSARLSLLVDRCTPEARGAFERLKECLPNGARRTL